MYLAVIFGAMLFVADLFSQGGASASFSAALVALFSAFAAANVTATVKGSPEPKSVTHANSPPPLAPSRDEEIHKAIGELQQATKLNGEALGVLMNAVLGTPVPKIAP